VRRAENTGWGQACLELLALAKEDFPSVSWADLIAVGAAAAIQKSGGPVIEVGLGRVDADEPAPRNRLPGGYEGGALLKRVFASKGLTSRDVVALTGAHTLGHVQTHPFTSDPRVFSNTYFVHLLSRPAISLLPTDHALVEDPELRSYVELYAQDEQQFFADFADAFRRLTWLGQVTPAATST
jgi:L-ascorbate peroxidase